MRTDTYLIAGIKFNICGETLPAAAEALGGFKVFRTEAAGEPSFVVMQTAEAAPAEGELLFSLFHDGVMMRFCSCEGGHLLTLIKGEEVESLWRTAKGVVKVSGSLDAQMLKFALWIGYGLETMDKMRIAFHGSCIVAEDRAYLFLGESGTGKSTHTRLWRENIKGCFLLNDDSPIISVEEDGIWAYGSPWSGKTPCYRQERYRLGGFVRLSQAPHNRIRRLSPLMAYAALHPSCPPQFAKDSLYDDISVTLNDILGGIPVYAMECLPDADAAFTSFNMLRDGSAR